MSGLKEAKELVKLHPGPLAEEVLAEAYAGRIADLNRAGLHAEATDLIAVARTRFPARAHTWVEVETAAARQRGDLSDLLRRWRDDPDQREALHAELRAQLGDPESIAECDVLPLDDPLRVEARGLRRAFVQAAAGGLDADGRAALQAVSRRSPLQPWRAFVLALDAFHRQDDQRCRAQLARIADGDSVAKARDVLRAAMFDADVPSSPTLQRAVDRLVGGAPAWRRSAAMALRRGAGRAETAAAIRATLVGLGSASPRLMMRFLRLLLAEGHRFHEIDRVLPDDFLARTLGFEHQERILYLLNEEPVAAVSGLASWLQSKPGELRRLSDLELATGLRRLAELMPDFGERMEEELPHKLDRAWRRGEPLSAHLEAYVQGDRLTTTVGVALTIVDTLFDLLRRRTGVERTGSDVRVQLLRHVVVLDPVRDSFELLLQAIEDDDADERPPREPVLLQWAAAIADDVEPLVRLQQDAEERGALRKALSYLERAEAVDGIDERVRQARVRVTLSRLHQHWRDGKRHLCRKDLADLEALAAFRGQEQRKFAQGVRALLDAEDGQAESGGSTAGCNTGTEPELADLVSLARWVLEGTPAAVTGVTLAERLARLALLARTARVVTSRDLPMPQDLDLAALRDEHLPSDPQDLLGLCGVALDDESAPLLFLAAGRGMQSDGPFLAAFLYARATSLSVLRPSACGSCFRLAVFYAERFGDRATLARARRYSLLLHEPMTPAEAAVALTAERARTTWWPSRSEQESMRRESRRRRRSGSRPPFPSPDDGGRGARP